MGIQNVLKSGVIVWRNAVCSDRYRRFGNYGSIVHAKSFPDKQLHIHC